MDIFDVMEGAPGRHRRKTMASVAAAESAMDQRVRRADSEIAELEARVDKLTTMCEAMWNLVCQTTGLTDAHLDYRFWELDTSDGSHDGRKRVRAHPCGSCDAMVSARLDRCQFCGAEAPKRTPWERI